MLLLVLALLPSPSRAAPLVRVDTVRGEALLPCATPLLLPDLLPAPDRASLPAAPPGAAKAEREAIEGVVDRRSSENFVVKWGAGGAVDEEAVQSLLDALEDAWAVQVEEMAFPAPVGAETWLLNVYVEDTGLSWVSGGGSWELSGSGASGYFTNDPEGYPMLVMSQGALGDAGYAAMVSAHELFHAVQAGLEAYPYGGRSAWYWEASATWMSAEVFPEIPDYSLFLFGYALLPWLPVDFFDYPDTGALQEYHQYGAFILPRYLSEHVADWTVVRDSWLAPDPGGDPVVALDAALSAWGTTVAGELVHLAARNATWDYVDGDVYAANLAEYGPSYPEGAHAVAEHAGAGSLGWRDAPEESRPRALGYNLVAWRSPAAGPLAVDFEGEAQGSAGAAATWSVEVVLEEPDGLRYLPVALEQGAGRLVVEEAGEASAAWLAVAVASDARDADESFAWRYQLLAGEVEGGDTGAGDGGAGDGGVGDSGVGDSGAPLDEAEAAACGCGGAGGLGPAPALGAGLFVLARRRRPDQRPPARARRSASRRSESSPSSSLL